ncbi:MAG: trifunctional transcriptional activator/DNA repair protein Ada/methylated-DNA--[protein]-cysteine S-methyltransferase [Acidobacteriota bacterium]
MKTGLPDKDVMYRAVVEKDSSFEGIFFTCVKTTGIFCRPGCTARKPKKENVEFFSTTKEALLHGYRPCKICDPMGHAGESPDWLKPVLSVMEKGNDIRLKDQDLREMGIDPNRVRRWFKKHHGMTFQAYLRTLRISEAFGRIRHGEKVIDAAYDSGYESLSGFSDTFRKTTGFSPKKSSEKNIILINRILSPLGPMLAGATEEGVCLLEFIDRRMLETQLKRIKKYFKADLVPGESSYFPRLNTELHEYFEGRRKNFSVPLVIAGTDFQKKVWKVLMDIPYGETRSYMDQAKVLGNPKAVRAVAGANGDNAIGIIIPCHRVIGSDGKLVGYGGGLWRKKFLLDLETGQNSNV